MKKAPLVAVGHAAADLHTLLIEQIRLDLLGRRAGDRQPSIDARPTERLERTKQDREPLALLGPADEEQPHVVGGRLRTGRSGREVDAVRDHLIVAAVPALGGPAGRL